MDDVGRRVLALLEQYGGIDGGHHKQWLLDQIARTVTGDGYAAWVAAFENGDDGPQSYEWDTGTAP